ncbi:Ribonuclease 3 [bioreactor metagenome]|uniref:ribonuclease III n=1 Tax=bioreactor metagenome TaxID=1076179 RepID=A0A645HIA4_9ZZZZ
MAGFDYNERLEFLGDSVLSILVSEHLYLNFKDLPEGELTKIRALVVCEQSLCLCAREINLGSYLQLGKGEQKNNGRSRPSILADAFEALIAAVYLDGGIDSVKNAVMPILLPMIQKAVSKKLHSDYKTALQEIVQKNKEEVLEYVLAQEKGPDHSKVFVVQLYLNSNVIATGEGKSKKEAEQEAAKSALRLMGEL